MNEPWKRFPGTAGIAEPAERKRCAERAGGRRHGRPGRRTGGRARRFTRVVVLLCAVFSVLVAADQLANAGEIRRGVSVGEVSLGGKTPAEAREILAGRAPGRMEEFRISGPGGSFAVSAGDLGARLDVRAAVGEAYAIGRRGGLPERLGERVRSAFGVDVPAEVRYRPGAVREVVEDLAARVNREPEDASLTVSGDGVRVAASTEGYRLDVPATTGNLKHALLDLSGEAEMSVETLRPAITTGEAHAATREVREAVSEPLVLTAEGGDGPSYQRPWGGRWMWYGAMACSGWSSTAAA